MTTHYSICTSKNVVERMNRTIVGLVSSMLKDKCLPLGCEVRLSILDCMCLIGPH